MAIDSEDTTRVTWLQRVLIGKNPKRTLARILVLAAVCFAVYRFVLLPIRVQGISMLPTFPDKGIHLVNRLAYLSHEPQRGDVVAIRLAGESVMLLKRIIGLPGETVAFQDGHAVINGQVLEEPYVKFPCNWEHKPEPVEQNEYYVVGDNRSMDFYDHTQGRSERRRIVGKVIR